MANSKKLRKPKELIRAFIYLQKKFGQITDIRYGNDSLEEKPKPVFVGTILPIGKGYYTRANDMRKQARANNEKKVA